MTEFEHFETNLPPELANYVHSQVGQPSLPSESDVLREMVRQAAECEAFKETTRQKIAAGVASLRAGRTVDGETYMAALMARLAAQVSQER